MKLHKSLTKVTPLSKALAMALFILLPFTAFVLGINFQAQLDTPFIEEQAHAVTANEALQLVSARPEVMKWAKTLGKTSFAAYSIDSQDDNVYQVRVYADFLHDPHTVVFGFYTVNKTTGKTTPSLP